MGQREQQVFVIALNSEEEEKIVLIVKKKKSDCNLAHIILMSPCYPAS